MAETQGIKWSDARLHMVTGVDPRRGCRDSRSEHIWAPGWRGRGSVRTRNLPCSSCPIIFVRTDDEPVASRSSSGKMTFDQRSIGNPFMAHRSLHGDTRFSCFQSKADIERFSVCTDPVAFDPFLTFGRELIEPHTPKILA